MVVAVVVGLVSGGARAEDGMTSRGPLTGVGIGLLAVGAVGLGLGAAGTVGFTDLNASIAATWPDGVPHDGSGDAAFRALDARRQADLTVLGVGYAMLGVGLIGGIVCLLLDMPRPLTVGFAPVKGGGAFALSLTF